MFRSTTLSDGFEHTCDRSGSPEVARLTAGAEGCGGEGGGATVSCGALKRHPLPPLGAAEAADPPFAGTGWLDMGSEWQASCSHAALSRLTLEGPVSSLYGPRNENGKFPPNPKKTLKTHSNNCSYGSARFQPRLQASRAEDGLHCHAARLGRRGGAWKLGRCRTGAASGAPACSAGKQAHP